MVSPRSDSVTPDASHAPKLWPAEPDSAISIVPWVFGSTNANAADPIKIGAVLSVTEMSTKSEYAGTGRTDDQHAAVGGSDLFNGLAQLVHR